MFFKFIVVDHRNNLKRKTKTNYSFNNNKSKISLICVLNPILLTKKLIHLIKSTVELLFNEMNILFKIVLQILLSVRTKRNLFLNID